VTLIPMQSRPAPLTFRGALPQSLRALRLLDEIADELGEEAELRTRHTVRAYSEAEVDGAAALMGVTPERPCPGHYQAAWRDGAATVTVLFTADATSPADVATIEAVCGMSAGDIPGSAA
jgi:hypothetical protein